MRNSIIVCFTKHFQDDEIRMGEMGGLFEERRSLGRHRRRWEDNIHMDFKNIERRRDLMD
jgi:hypothetical protein